MIRDHHQDHYQALGVLPTADHATVRAAYRALMRSVHPDVRPGDPEAEEAARRANAAWSVLSDSARRASYDRLRVGGGRVEDLRPPSRPSAGRPAGGPPPVVRPAVSPDGAEYRAAFHRACVRVGGTVAAVGTVLLLALS